MNYILDYKGNKTFLPFNLEDDKVIEAFLDVVTGDEILTAIVELEDGSRAEQVFDSSDCRLRDYPDAGCFLKVDGKLTEEFNDSFINRVRSYGYY